MGKQVPYKSTQAFSTQRMDTNITPQFPVTLRRILLIFISLIVSVMMGSALLASLNEPQVASRLELYQADLLLQATAWDGNGFPSEQTELLRQNLLGANPLKDTQKAYESVRKTARETLENQAIASDEAISPRLQAALAGQAELLDLLDLRLGILQAEQRQVEEALQSWQSLQARQSQGSALWQTANTLRVLWLDHPIPANSEALLQSNLQGWFRDRALAQLYARTEATEALAQLQQAESTRAERTILILAAVGGLPAIGSILGLVVLTVIGIQRFVKGPESLLARNRDQRWETPWTAETIWLVLVGGFFFIGQLVAPVLLIPLKSLAALGIRGQALFSLTYYLVMAVGTIAVLWFAIRTHRPLPKDWFRFGLKGKWLLWGVGGYLAALPLMLAVAILNQQLWQGQGGSNPLLQTVLEAQDPVALTLFFSTAAIAAPLFEEVLFRGFLLPSLTRYMPVWGAIVLSSFIFAAAHLSLSEILPLMVLGMILGVVYTRSRNLLAPMLLHSAWNSITMLGLFLLGSSAG